VGVVFPRCRFDRASDIPVASPYLPVLTPLRACSCFTRSSPRRLDEVEVARGPDREEAAKAAVTTEP
jgi:hypothetical protein